MVAMGEEAKLTVLPQPQFPQWDVTVKISAVLSRDCTSKSHVSWVLANVFSGEHLVWGSCMGDEVGQLLGRVARPRSDSLVNSRAGPSAALCTVSHPLLVNLLGRALCSSVCICGHLLCPQCASPLHSPTFLKVRTDYVRKGR